MIGQEKVHIGESMIVVLAPINVVYLKVIVTMMMNALAIFYADQKIVFLHFHLLLTAVMTLFWVSKDFKSSFKVSKFFRVRIIIQFW